MARVTGKVAIVTGGARGMGAAHARRLAEEGAMIVITDVLDAEGEAMANSLGESVRFIHHDVTRERDWQAVVMQAEAAFGPISVLVNNAGIATRRVPTEDLEEADYRRIIDINQVSVFLGMKAVIPSMKRAGGGSIINISSTAGLVGVPQALGYTASKFAVRGMTKAAAIELAADNIRVNSVHPGLVRTPLTIPVPAAEDILTARAATTPAGRLGEPDEVAAIVVMLASDESRFTTGAEIVVDGGAICQ